ncbi:hypothetical protein PUNSTDRAFT_101822 [Punctularia strigosozonata HHB-11173 SS5]|uniref:uncharacterized protein n=1 Tax=Punctularia strigosozonata (strain HHB-11173) TaxID=741275 RepID=UPI00044162BA|nr:uncharacterized protein PUNSTDRAFT_101822 [Punctularia strigosozonata HHB-11173 SS5]EIN09860.1 hypothetical protein PUNSTDRAFT_101822 [Punctularia strigosozonata HHB-11173 SS5]
MSTSIFVSAFAPFPTLTLSVPSDAFLFDVPDLLAERYPSLPRHLRLSTLRGDVAPDTPLSALSAPGELLSLRIAPRILGGKGGFGSQLRAAGGRMSSQKTSNNDSCRDLSGRRLSTIKEAKKLAEYLESEPERKKAAAEAQRAKLEALEKKLGLTPGAGPSSSSSPGDAPEPLAGKKHRFDDQEYIEQSRDIVDNVRSAVSVAMLKKKKKAKTSHTSANAEAAAAVAAKDVRETMSATVKDAAADTAVGATTVTEKVVASSATAPIAVAASLAVGITA